MVEVAPTLRETERPMDDNFRDLFEESLERGARNQEVLQLAAAWCQNVGVTKGPFGTGALEQLTGLPITGGSLRCDHAKAPTLFGMRLEDSAVAFYEANCIGCPHRQGTDAEEHLGTWADAVIDGREKLRQQQEQVRQEAEKARQRRHEHRRLMFGAPDVTLQSILDLIDRVDAEARDLEAEGFLLDHARMSPGDFPDPLIEHLAHEAIAIGNAAILETVIAVFERQARPRVSTMLELAFQAVDCNVAAEAAGRVIAVHAAQSDFGDRELAGIVRLAAGHQAEEGSHWVGAEPAVLLRLFDEAPSQAIELLAASLRCEDVWMRATAAHAAEKLVGARPTAAPALLHALFDAAQLPDNSRYYRDPFAAAHAQLVVADIFAAQPRATAHLLNAEIRKADAKSARKLWGCYDKAANPRHDELLSPEAANMIATRAIALLRKALDLELATDVANTLAMICTYHGEGLNLDLDVLIQLLQRWADFLLDYNRSESALTEGSKQQEILLAYLEEGHDVHLKISTVHGKLKEVVTAIAKQEPGRYLRFVTDRARDQSRISSAQHSLLQIAGEVVRNQRDLCIITPSLITSLNSNDVKEKTTALRAISKIGQRDIKIGIELGQCILTIIAREKEIVVAGAIDVLWHVDIPSPMKPDVINFLLGFAKVYGPQRLCPSVVESALSLAVHLAKDEKYIHTVTQRSLEIIAEFPSAEAVSPLRWLPFERHPAWPAAVVQALHIDPDPRYFDFRDGERAELLRRLASLPTEQLSPHLDDLEKVAGARLSHEHSWVWAIADVFARHHEHQRAASLCDTVIASLPDTFEQRPMRRFARQVALGHHLNAAIAAGDEKAAQQALSEWAKIADAKAAER